MTYGPLTGKDIAANSAHTTSPAARSRPPLPAPPAADPGSAALEGRGRTADLRGHPGDAVGAAAAGPPHLPDAARPDLRRAG